MKIISHFNKLVNRYDSYSSLANNPQIKQSLGEYLGEIEKGLILDVATGTGNFGKILVNKGSIVIGLDINKNMLIEAKKKRLLPFLATAFKLSFQQKSFDLILCRQLFQYRYYSGE